MGFARGRPDPMAARKIGQTQIKQTLMDDGSSGFSPEALVRPLLMGVCGVVACGAAYVVAVTALPGMQLFGTIVANGGNTGGGIAAVRTEADVKRVNAVLGVQRKLVQAAVGKKSCDDFTPEELEKRQAAHWKRIEKGQKNPMALALSMQGGAAMGDMMAVQCGFMALAGGERSNGMHESGRRRTAAEQRLYDEQQARQRRERWRRERDG